MSRVKIKKLQNKTKILIEYPTKIGISFATLFSDDELIFNVFLKDGSRIYHENIKQITIKAKDD